MNSGAFVYGSLACVVEPEPNSKQDSRPQLTVVSGGRGKNASAQATPRQFAAPDVYASSHAQAAPRSRVIVYAIATFALLVAIGAAVYSFMQARSTARAAFIDTLDEQTVEVQAGESLWDIAAAHEVEGLATSESVDLIRSWNDLSNATIHPGMELFVPVAAS